MLILFTFFVHENVLFYINFLFPNAIFERALKLFLSMIFLIIHERAGGIKATADTDLAYYTIYL